MLEEAKQHMNAFLMQLDNKDFPDMYLDTSVSPPLLVYEKGDKYVAMDPAAGHFYVDKSRLFNVPFDFNGTPEIYTRVDRAGKAVMDKARNDALTMWLNNMKL